MKSDMPNQLPLASNPDSPLSRRQLLVTMAAGAVAVTVGAALGGRAFAAPMAATPPAPRLPVDEGKIRRAVGPEVMPFNLADVRLGAGPFLEAQKRDEKYLLELEPDRLLANFRKNAGLTPKAPVYGGWESVQPWIDIRCHGHTLGHYLSACAMMYASTGDAKFKERCDYIVADLKECQTKLGTGLICAFPDGAAPFAAIAAGRNFPGVIWYTMHKIFAGLRDTHLFAGSADGLAVAAKLADFCIATTEKLTDQQFQRMLGVEHGGMNEVLADIHVLTGEKKYLDLAERFCHHQVMDPAAQGRDTLDGLHSNTQIPKFIGFQRLYEVTGKADYQAAAKFFWQTVTGTRSFVTGGNGDGEHFFAIRDFARHVTSGKTMETCCSHNMLRLTRALFTLNPAANLADYYEKTLYNTILASQDPDSGMMTYFQPTRPGYLKFYCTPTDSFWCCTGTGIENHAKYGDSIYFHNTEELFVNLFIASTVAWKAKGVTVTQTTNFPDEPTTRLKVTAAAPVALALRIRHPSWCKAVTVKVNGQVVETSTMPGSYIGVTRTWQGETEVEVALPMTMRMEFLPGTTDMAAAVYGPIVLAGKLGTQGLAPGKDIIVNERTIGTVLNQAVTVPEVGSDVNKVLEGIKPVAGKALTFTTAVAGGGAGGEPVTMVPYFRVAHERYTIYWRMSQA